MDIDYIQLYDMAHFSITHNVSVYRLARASNQEEYSASPVYSGLDVSIVPASSDILAFFGEPSMSLYEIFIEEVAELKVGDKLTSGSDEWIIRGVPMVYSHPALTYTRAVGEKVV